MLAPESYSTPDGEWCRGADDAPITIDVYPDFLCPSCVEKELVAVQTLLMYPEEVRMVYHHYPSSGFSEKLAEALEAAGEQGKFWEMHDRLMENVPGDMSELKAAGKELGLDIQKFSQALESGKFTEKVQLAKQKAISEGIRYVSIYINGQEYKKYPCTLDELRQVIDEELRRLDTDVSD